MELRPGTWKVGIKCEMDSAAYDLRVNVAALTGRSTRGENQDVATRKASAVAQKNLERLRRLCLALPEAQEKEAWGDPTFRVRDKIFAMHKVGDGRPSVWCKSEPFERDALVEHDPESYYVPPYVGHRGWIGVRLDRAGVDWKEVSCIVTQSYRLIAPKRLAALVGADR